LSHLDDQTLAHLFAGRLKTDEGAEARAHLSNCPDCQRRFDTVNAALATTLSPSLPPASPAPEILRGTSLGRYMVIDLLGTGGMGQVYAAYDPELNRRVALKLLRSQASTSAAAEQDQARLMREARAMARLSHPNVVTVYDVGAYQDGVFIAMELVKGVHLQRWLKEKRASWQQTLSLFVDAGRGLSAAHAAGLIHRDFKPHNVLVSDDGRARVTDFGLARGQSSSGEFEGSGPFVSDPRSLAETLRAPLTQVGEVVGTPGYMSPEQIRSTGVDARSDQFSFCASLYESIYSELPFQGVTLAALIKNIETGEVQPPPKGSRVPPWLRSALLRGLSSKPGDRFASMDDLLRVLGRARTDRRPKLAVAALVTIVVAGVGTAVYLRVLERRGLCQGAERKLVGVWDEPIQAKAKAAFLATGLPYAEPAWASAQRMVGAYSHDWVALHTQSCEATRLRGEESEEVLDLKMICLTQRLQEIKAASDLFASADRKVVEKAAQIASGLAPLSSCADVEALKAPLRPPKDAATRAKVEDARGQIAKAKALETSGKYEEGLSVAEPALQSARSTGYAPIEAEALFQLGKLQMLARKDTLAQGTLEEAFRTAEACGHNQVAAQSSIGLVTTVGRNLARSNDGHLWVRLAKAVVQRAERGEEGTLAAQLGGNEGDLLWTEGKYEEALAEHRHALSIRERVLGPDHAEVAQSHNSIGIVLDDEGKYDEALAEYRRALAMRERILGAEHPDVAGSHNNIGLALGRQGKYEEALAEHRRALAIRETVLGPDHPDVAASYNNIGLVLEDQGKYAQALAEFQRALAIREKALGPDHPDVALSHNNIGVALDDQGKSDQALPEFRRALAIREKALDPDHPDVAQSHNNIGVVLTEQGKYAEALTELGRALAIREKALGPDHRDVALSHNNIGEAFEGQGKYKEALAEYRRALMIQERVLGPEHPDAALSHHDIGNALKTQGRYDEALAELRRALAIQEKLLGPEHPDVAASYASIGESLDAQGKHSEAAQQLNRALVMLEAKAAPPRDLGEVRFALAAALWGEKKDRARAVDLARKAREDYAKAPARKKEAAQIDAWLATHRTPTR
jgi:eukaryotic-like serine/threonine-protein kinase